MYREHCTNELPLVVMKLTEIQLFVCPTQYSWLFILFFWGQSGLFYNKTAIYLCWVWQLQVIRLSKINLLLKFIKLMGSSFPAAICMINVQYMCCLRATGSYFNWPRQVQDMQLMFDENVFRFIKFPKNSPSMYSEFVDMISDTTCVCSVLENIDLYYIIIPLLLMAANIKLHIVHKVNGYFDAAIRNMATCFLVLVKSQRSLHYLSFYMTSCWFYGIFVDMKFWINDVTFNYVLFASFEAIYSIENIALIWTTATKLKCQSDSDSE